MMTQVRMQHKAARARPATPRQAVRRTTPLDRLLDPALFRALGERNRLTLLACIAKCGRACSVGEVAQCCSVDLSVVSRHLAALARAGVLDVEKAGRVVRYKVRYSQLVATLRGLADALDGCSPGRDEPGCDEGGCRGCC